MRYRPFGASGLRVSEVFLGAMTFGEQGGVGAPLDECRRMVDAYADAGGNVIDTAINYRGGASEEVLGELLQGRRDRFVLATKFGVSRDVKSISDASSGPSDPNAAGGHRKNLMLSLEMSLRRLRTDHVDVYWLHLYDRHTPIDETMRALDDAVRAGKVLYIGVSDTPAWVIARAQVLAEWRGWTPFVGLQVPYSLVERDIERELLPLAEAHGMTVAAWSPLAGGVLSGKFTRGGAGAGAGATRRDPSSLSERSSPWRAPSTQWPTSSAPRRHASRLPGRASDRRSCIRSSARARWNNSPTISARSTSCSPTTRWRASTPPRPSNSGSPTTSSNRSARGCSARRTVGPTRASTRVPSDVRRPRSTRTRVATFLHVLIAITEQSSEQLSEDHC